MTSLARPAAGRLAQALVGERGAAPKAPVTVGGFLSAVSGLGEGARRFANAVEAADIPCVRWDLSLAFGHKKIQRNDYLDEPPAGSGMLVLHLNGPETVQLALQHPHALRTRRVIGYWAWETEKLPTSWRAAFALVDEVWCPSRFVADAVAALAPADLPVRVVPHAVPISDARPDRARFGLSADRPVVLAAFDVRSALARKNPAGAVEAFVRAVGRSPPTTAAPLLVCKVVEGDFEPTPQWTSLKATLQRRPDVRLLLDPLSDHEMDVLIASADVVMSLHRAEGFGLLPARAAALGTPVVTTGWSGVLDFLDAESAALVAYRLVPVDDPEGVYAEGLWAEPDLDDAAAKLAALLADPERRRTLGDRGRRRVAETLSQAAWLRAASPGLPERSS